MKLVKSICLAAVAVSTLSASTAFADPLKIIFTHHSSASNSFWRGVKADCQMLFTNTEGAIADQVNNMKTAIALQPAAIVTAISNDEALCPVIKEARDRGIIVIASNVDATTPDCGRLSYMGQNFIDAGKILGERTTALFPAEGPIRVLLGISAPGGNWAEQRAKGIEEALAKWKEANPSRELVVDRIDSGTDLAVVAERVIAYYDANPTLNAYQNMH
jgi:simple sugar transport system substrate-binding protein